MTKIPSNRGDSHLRVALRIAAAAALALLCLAGGASLAFAHTGPPPTPQSIWLNWSFDPTVILGVLAGGWLYLRGLQRLWDHPGASRRRLQWQATAFAAALATIVIALLSPLDALSSALFSAHMVQHLLLMLVAAPLFVFSEPAQPFLWAFPLDWRRRLAHWQRKPILRRSWHLLSLPLMAWWIQTVVLWSWHVPYCYDAALQHELLHAFEHLTLLASAWLFWYTVFPFGHHGRFSYGAAVASDFLTAVQMTVLAIALTFAPSVIYTSYLGTTSAWGLTPLLDQQIAGLIMWVPASGVYLIACLVIVTLWIQSADDESRRLEDQNGSMGLVRNTRRRGVAAPDETILDAADTRPALHSEV